jgi:hypothetical protein
MRMFSETADGISRSRSTLIKHDIVSAFLYRAYIRYKKLTSLGNELRQSPTKQKCEVADESREKALMTTRTSCDDRTLGAPRQCHSRFNPSCELSAPPAETPQTVTSGGNFTRNVEG